jgi:hypothetical protein
MARKPHPKPEVESALKYAEQERWRIEVGGSHAWGRMYCPYNDETCRCGEFCIASIRKTRETTANRSGASSTTARCIAR